MMNRRGFLTGLVAAVAAPAIVRPGLIMPIKPRLVPITWRQEYVWPESAMSELIERHIRRSAQVILDATEDDLWGPTKAGSPRRW